MDDEVESGGDGGGVPAWVMTFADLMTLLMCFFVLLLAFSEMDAQKFKLLSGSMKNAFGVQAEIKANEIPKGTSVIATEFSPGQPQATPINAVRQFTIDSNQNSLQHGKEKGQQQNEQEKQAEADARRLRKALKSEIAEGKVMVAKAGSRVIIHILEKGSFRSGYAEVEPAFVVTLSRISGLLATMDGVIRVAGHTDDVPISNSVFPSNWALSAGRAVSVAHKLLEETALDPGRILITGHGDTRPQVSNDSPENRARNRRVDISIIRDPAEMEAIGMSSAESARQVIETASEPADDTAPAEAALAQSEDELN